MPRNPEIRVLAFQNVDCKHFAVRLQDRLLDPPPMVPSPNEALSGSPLPENVELAEGTQSFPWECKEVVYAAWLSKRHHLTARGGWGLELLAWRPSEHSQGDAAAFSSKSIKELIKELFMSHSLSGSQSIGIPRAGGRAFR